MKYRLLNFLICPNCKAFPLKYVIFEEKIYRNREFKLKPCDLYCGFREKYLKDLDSDLPCNECIKHEIMDGYLYCDKCREWYPIINGIVIMHIGELRPKKVIREFIDKYRDKIPHHYVERELER
jgi:uncharacterized protein YbaR (Trm112 family)